MDDLISRQEALYILDEEKREMENCLAQETDKNVMQYEDGYLAAVEKIAFSIKNSLGTEARRCKDCRHRYLENNTWHCPFGISGGEDFFCGYSVQPSESSGNMSGTHKSLDCISRQAAIDAIHEWGLIDGLSEGQAIEILSDEEKVPSVQPPRWIPVSEALPEEKQDVLLAFKHNMVVGFWEDILNDGGQAWYANSGNGWMTGTETVDDDGFPLAWMPLPEPWRGGQDE